MSKMKQSFSCQSCGTVYPKWTGQCLGCNQWNTIVEEVASNETPASRYQGYAGHEAAITRMLDVTLEESLRLSSGIW